jgi:hypothetical protein
MFPRLSTSLIAILLLVSTTTGYATLRWDQTVQTGELSPDQDTVQAEFAFTNDGDRPVTIKAAQASCGCTKPTYPTEVIAPGAKGKITVAYSRSGAQQQLSRITVTTDEPNREPYVLSWQLTVREWAEIAPRLLLWTRTEEPRAKVFRVNLPAGSDAKFLEVVGAPETLSVTVTHPAEGTAEPINIHVTPAASALTQPLRATLRLRFQRGKEIVERSVYVRVQ